MAKHINLTEKLSNEKPSITINGKEYEVNDEKSNVLAMNSMIKSGEFDEIELFGKVIESGLGKKSAKEIDAMKLRFVNYQKIAFAIIACMNDEDLETVEERFQ